MEFETPRACLSDPLFGCNMMENDVFAAQFASYVAHSIKQEDDSMSPAWSRQSSPSSSYSLDHSTTGTDCTDTSRTASSSSHDEANASKTKKRASRYKDCSETALTRRREQNRANQRAYRKRKEQRIQELEDQLDEMSQKNQALACSCSLLSKECARLRSHVQDLSNPTTAWSSGAGAGAGAQDTGAAALAAVYAKIEAALSSSGAPYS